MKTGNSTVDSVENGQVKMLFQEDESIIELQPIGKFTFDVKECDIISVTANEGKYGYEISLLENETKEMKSKVSNLIEKLENKK